MFDNRVLWGEKAESRLTSGTHPFSALMIFVVIDDRWLSFIIREHWNKDFEPTYLGLKLEEQATCFCYSNSCLRLSSSDLDWLLKLTTY